MITNHRGDHVVVTQQSYVTASADNLVHLETNSIDLFFTDLPFGLNIFYADMHLFHEAWLEQYTDHTVEDIIRMTGKEKIKSKKLQKIF